MPRNFDRVLPFALAASLATEAGIVEGKKSGTRIERRGGGEVKKEIKIKEKDRSKPLIITGTTESNVGILTPGEKAENITGQRFCAVKIRWLDSTGAEIKKEQYRFQGTAPEELPGMTEMRDGGIEVLAPIGSTKVEIVFMPLKILE